MILTTGRAWEKLRVTIRVKYPDGAYKLNNDFTSRYARMIMLEPDLDRLFELRELKTE